LPAEELLALGDVALLPWVPLAKLSGPPDRIVERCKARIDHEVPSPERQDLLTVAQFLLRLRYDKETVPRLQELLGGREAMLESPLYQEIVEEARREGETRAMQRDILDLLEIRFGPEAKDLEVELNAIAFDRLRELHRLAATSRNLASFRKRLLSS
jgi:predicted transposase YdaD